MLSVDPTVSLGVPPVRGSVAPGGPPAASVPAGATDGVFSALLDDRVWVLPAAGFGTGSADGEGSQDSAADAGREGPAPQSPDGVASPSFDVLPLLPPTVFPALATAGRPSEAHRSSPPDPVPVQQSPDGVEARTFDLSLRLPTTDLLARATPGAPPPAHRSSPPDPVPVQQSPDGVEARTFDLSLRLPTADLPALATTGAPPTAHRSSPPDPVPVQQSSDGVEARTFDLSLRLPTTDLPALATTGPALTAHRASPPDPVPVQAAGIGAAPAATDSSDRSVPSLPGSAFGTERVAQSGPGRHGVDRTSAVVHLESARLVPSPESRAALVPDVQTAQAAVGVVLAESASHAQPDGSVSTPPGRDASMRPVVPANEAAVGAAPAGAAGPPGEPAITSLPFSLSAPPPVPDGPVVDGRLPSAASALPGRVPGIPDGPADKPVLAPGTRPVPAQTGYAPAGGLPVSGESSVQTAAGPTTPVQVLPTATRVAPGGDDGALRSEIERPPAPVHSMPAPLLRATPHSSATVRLTQPYFLDTARPSAGDRVDSMRAETFDVESPATRDRLFDLDPFDTPPARPARVVLRPRERVVVDMFRQEGRSVDRTLPLAVTAQGAVIPAATSLFAVAPLGARRACCLP